MSPYVSHVQLQISYEGEVTSLRSLKGLGWPPTHCSKESTVPLIQQIFWCLTIEKLSLFVNIHFSSNTECTNNFELS